MCIKNEIKNLGCSNGYVFDWINFVYVLGWKMNEEAKLFKEFEEKFGFKCYEELKSIMASLHERNKQIKDSRDKWKERCLEAEKK